MPERDTAEDMILTDRQTEVVEFVRHWWAEHGYGPSMQDIGDGLTISKTAAFADVKRLVHKGALRYTPRVRRSVRLPKGETDGSRDRS